MPCALKPSEAVASTTLVVGDCLATTVSPFANWLKAVGMPAGAHGTGLIVSEGASERIMAYVRVCCLHQSCSPSMSAGAVLHPPAVHECRDVCNDK